MIAVKWNADVHDHEYTWCTVLATTHVASGAELTLMHEQAVDVPGHPAGDPTHVTYSWKVYTSDYRTKWMVYNFDNAAEHTEHVLSFVNEVHFDDTFTFDDCWDANGVIDHLKIANLSGVPGDFDDNEYDTRQALLRYPSRTAAQPVAAKLHRVVAAIADFQAGLCLAARLALGRCLA